MVIRLILPVDGKDEYRVIQCIKTKELLEPLTKLHSFSFSNLFSKIKHYSESKAYET